MSRSTNLIQPLLCVVGYHQRPPQRNPPGPIVADCPCCRRTIYCYGMHWYPVASQPMLLLPPFPRVLGPVAVLNR